MAKATKQLGGGAKDKYFRDLFAAAPGLAPVLARRLTELTKAEVSQVRVRQPLLDRAGLLGSAAETTPTAEAKPSKPAQTEPPAKPAEAAKPAETKAAFDPFAFTAVVVLKRQGADALAKLLAEIADPAHLRQLADKQHLGVPADTQDAPTLRQAILKSAQSRIDDRRAAAS